MKLKKTLSTIKNSFIDKYCKCETQRFVGAKCKSIINYERESENVLMWPKILEV